MAAEAANRLDQLMGGITGLNGCIDAEVEENLRPVVELGRRLRTRRS
jgi:hypothetical protein